MKEKKTSILRHSYWVSGGVGGPSDYFVTPNLSWGWVGLCQKHDACLLLCWVYNTAAIFNFRNGYRTLSCNIHLCIQGRFYLQLGLIFSARCNYIVILQILWLLCSSDNPSTKNIPERGLECLGRVNCPREGVTQWVFPRVGNSADRLV